MKASDYQQSPYPGQRPETSYVIDAYGQVIPLETAADMPSGWAVPQAGDPVDLDEWLAANDAAPLSSRVPLLSYGSNGCPAKIVANKTSLPSVNIACRTMGLAAVWCAGTRGGPGDVPATLAVAPGHDEAHFLTYVLPADFRALDDVEGRVPGRSRQWYDLCTVEAGRVVREDGLEVTAAVTYVGGRPERWPALDEHGEMVAVRHGTRSAEASQSRALAMVSAGAPTRRPEPVGTTLHDTPAAPVVNRVFVYGTLMPGEGRWSALEPYADRYRRATITGSLFDTGRGWPAAFPSAQGEIPGWLVTLHSERTAEALGILDAIEGTSSGLFSRQMRVVDGEAAWVYLGADDSLRRRRIPRWAGEEAVATQ